MGGLVAVCVRPTTKKSIWTVSKRQWLVALVITVSVGRPVISSLSRTWYFARTILVRGFG